MNNRTARRGAVVASLALVGTVGAGTVGATTVPAGDGEPLRLGILAECEGAFGGFNEDVQAGVTLAMVNAAGATVNSTTTAHRRLHRSGGRRATDRGRGRRLW